MGHGRPHEAFIRNVICANESCGNSARQRLCRDEIHMADSMNNIKALNRDDLMLSKTTWREKRGAHPDYFGKEYVDKLVNKSMTKSMKIRSWGQNMLLGSHSFDGVYSLCLVSRRVLHTHPLTSRHVFRRYFK